MNHKDVGGLAEIGFIYEAKKRGLHIMKPMTDNRKYDFIVDGGSLYKIQVKSTAAKEKNRNNFKVSTSYGSHKKIKYQKEDVDFIAIHLTLADIWYIIPIENIKYLNIRFYPHKEDCKFNKWREAWYLLQ